MTTPLLTTKLYFPSARPSLVSRPRLVERLVTGLQGPLTLLSAPAGSGKTMLLSEWRQGPGAEMPVAWLSLDTGDNTPVTFFQYLCAALDGVKSGLAAQAAPLLSASETIRLGGGAMEDPASLVFWDAQINGMPIMICPGPYWVAGQTYPLDTVGPETPPADTVHLGTP